MRKRVLRRAVMTAATLAFLVSSVAHAGTTGDSGSASQASRPAALSGAPVVTVPADLTAEGDTLGGWLSWFSATATDASGGSLPVVCTPASGSVMPLGTTTVTCSATDSAGTPGSASFDVTVVDTTFPMLTSVPAMIWAETANPTGDIVGWPAPWAVDTVDGLVPVTCTPASGSHFLLGAAPVMCSATDASGNVETSAFMVYLTLVDSTPPEISDMPADIVVDTTDPWGATVTWPSPTATDNIDGPLPVICAPAADTFFYGGWTVVTCTATDLRGNAATAEFNVTVNTTPVVDTTPPTLSNVPTGIAVDTYDPSGAVVTWDEPTAMDDVDGLLTVNCTPASGSLFEVGTTIVECSATDGSGNDGTAAPFTVQVTLLDITPPVISGVPANLARPATSLGGVAVSWATPSATDNVDGLLAVTCRPASGSVFAVGTTRVTCSATDAHGNRASDSFNVVVTYVDTTPPALFGVPTAIWMDTPDPSGATVGWTAPTAVDDVDGPVTVACTPASGSHFAVGNTSVVCSASDRAGNVATADPFVVHLQLVDSTDPVISGMPADISLGTTDPTGAIATWTAPTAADNISGPVPVVCAPATGSRFPVGRTDVTCTASDGAGNVAARSFAVRVTLTIVDTTPPTLVGMPGDITVQASPSARMTVTWPAPSAVDDVDGSVPVTCTPPSGGAFPVGSTTVTCTASDAAGNVARGSFTVTVTATTPDPEPVPGAGLQVKWAKPIGASQQYTVKIGKKLELKAKIAVDGVALRKKAGPPKLVVERLDACGGTVVGRRDGGKLKWDDGAWRVDLKTSKLGTGCWRLSVALGTAQAGAFELTIREKDVRKRGDKPESSNDDGVSDEGDDKGKGDGDDKDERD